MIYYTLFETTLNCDVDPSRILNVLIKSFGLIYYLLMMHYDHYNPFSNRIWESEGVKNRSRNILWFCHKSLCQTSSVWPFDSRNVSVAEQQWRKASLQITEMCAFKPTENYQSSNRVQGDVLGSATPTCNKTSPLQKRKRGII